MFSLPCACLILCFFGLSPAHEDELKGGLVLSGQKMSLHRNCALNSCFEYAVGFGLVI